MEHINVGQMERRLERAANGMKSGKAERDAMISALARYQVPRDRIMALSGLTKGRISQIIKASEG